MFIIFFFYETQEIIQAVLCGDLTSNSVNDLATHNNKIIIFVSSTFTDTAAERNALMRGTRLYCEPLLSYYSVLQQRLSCRYYYITILFIRRW